MRRTPKVAGTILALLLAAGPLAAQCEPTVDCNANGVLDSCDIALGTSDDCDQNGVPDSCDIASGSQVDCNFNGIPDSCEPAPPAPLVVAGGFASATSVSIRGNLAAVGSALDSTAAAGAGAVHIFRRVGTIWVPEGPPLFASDAAANDEFGSSVSLDGDFLAVGAPGDNLGATVDTGSIYIFRRSLGTWLQVAKLTLASPQAGDSLGAAVSIRGNRLIAGAPMTGSTSAGKGAIFAFDGLAWSIDALLQPAGIAAGDRLGSAVAIGVTHAFIGAPGRTALGAAGAGETFVYELSGSWGLASTLRAAPPEAGAQFGAALAGGDALIVVGAPDQDLLAGAVHIFEKSGGVWGLETVLSTPSAAPGERFGASVSLGVSGGRIAIAELGTGGPSPVPGRAHVHRSLNGQWSVLSTIDGAIGEDFGRALSTDGRYAIIAAPAATPPAATVHWVAPSADCNSNGIDDACDIGQGTSTDCNGNTIPDSCDLAGGTSADCDSDLIPDECEILQNPALDCNDNGVLDACDLAAQSSLDCNANGVPDECDITDGTDTDCDQNGVPDACQGFADLIDPVISNLPGNLSAGTDPGLCTATVTWTPPTVTDDCAVASVVSSHASGASFPIGTTTVVITATDTAGNVATASFTVTVADTSGPTITGLPSSFTVPSAPGLCSAVVSWTPPTASDGCGLISLTSNVQPGSTRPVGVTTVTYTAIDLFANVTQASFTVTVVDQGAPVIVGMPANIALTAVPGACGRTATWTPPGVADNCSSPSLVPNFAPGSFFPVGTTTVVYTATDASGNSAQASFTVTVTDTTPPAISGLPAPQTITSPPGSCTAVATWTPPTASDNCGVASLTATHSPGAALSPGTTTVTYTATDIHGNSAVASFSITVLDSQPPVISGTPANISLVAAAGTCSRVASWTPPTASDNCSVASFSGSALPGSSFPVGTTTVTYTATDPSGNATNASFTVTVQDLQAPTIPDLPVGVVAGTNSGSCQATVSWTPPVGADNCSVASVVSSHSPGQLFPLGNTLVSVTVTDASGNTAAGSFTVTVVDDDLPQITGLPSGLTIPAAAGSCGSTVSWAAPAISDNCGVASSSASHASGAFFPVGTTVVAYQATDAAGNIATASFPITVTDTSPPLILGVPSNLSVATALGQCAAVVSWTPPTASDNCALASFTASHIPGQSFPVGLTVVTYTATDASGGTTQASFTITVADQQPPTLVVGADIFLSVPPGGCIATVDVPVPTRTDNCGFVSLVNDVTGTSNASGDYPAGVTVITWTAIDLHGNLTVDTQTVTVDVPLGADCNQNGFPDACDIAEGASEDCNGNGIPDECDIAQGGSVDQNGNGVPDECDPNFERGDANDDGSLNIADAVYLLATLFSGGPAPHCLDAADSNDDGFLDISDVIFSVTYIFAGGPPPPAPYPACGLDGTNGDFLDCDSSACP